MCIASGDELVAMECDHCGYSKEVDLDEEPGGYFEKVGYRLGDDFEIRFFCLSCSELFWTGFVLGEQMAKEKQDAAFADDGHRS